jgi:hypothetical protein
VQAVTPDDIQRVARQYVRADRLSIVLVGDAASFVPQLRKVGFPDVEVIPIQDLDLMSASLRRDAPRASVDKPVGSVASFRAFESFGFRRPNQLAYTATQVNPRPSTPNVPDASSGATDPNATAVLKHVLEAKGGLDALKKVRTVVADSETTFHMSGQPLVSKTRTYVAYPDKFRVDADVRGVQVVQVYSGGSAWARDPAGVHDAPPGMRDDFAASVRRDMIPMLVGAAEGKLSVRLLPEQASDGQALKVLEIRGAALPPVKLFVDGHSLVVRQSFQTPGPDGRPIEAEEVFSDYRAVDGVQVPFKAEVRRNGTRILSRTLTSVTFNSPLDETLFVRPQ